jgi:DNA-binding LytR/AlgR family response regulator
MNILIIDDNDPDARQLEKLLKEVAPDKKVMGRCCSVNDSLEWFQKHPMPDLVFSVVELPDGLSFEIFNKLEKRPPVIFTCPYEKYAIDAFKANGIYYILKPVKKEALKEAINRHATLFPYKLNGTSVVPGPPAGKNTFQERFLVTVGRQMRLIKADEVAYFFTEHKIVYLVTFQGAKYRTSFTLERLEGQLNPAVFFRINRQFIINVSAIVKLLPASKSRLEVMLRPETGHNTTTSFGRTDSFCHWMLGGFSMS